MGDAAQTENGFATVSSALQSSDNGQLLDVIDHLRALGIDRHVPLPQLVVCGDQSSGKSSVLEAVSGVRFPTKDTVCTRFATELVLRHSVSESVHIKIRPSHDRSDDEKAKLLAFAPPSVDRHQFPLLVEAAKKAIGLDDHTTGFSKDVLHVEVSGPQQPHLTLVDLPGLFHSGNKQQSAHEAKLVKSLVQQYMKNERSIILAVVSAKTDYANQIVTELARKFDPKGFRTMGIVTSPDTLIPGSDSEASFLSLVKNEDVSFRLGWHVLRNRDFNMKNYSTEERDQEEQVFFSRGVWTSLPADSLGVDTLRPRLSNALREQIISVLPNLIEDVERGIKGCNSRLKKLGDTRGTLEEQRQYLVRTSQRFSMLVKASVDGVYDDDYFGDPMTPEGESKRVRAVVQHLLLRFAKDIGAHGRHQIIIDDSAELSDSYVGRKIRRSAYLNHVRDLMRRTRGRELPGTFNPLIVGDLFFEQSKPWEALIKQYCRDVIDAIKNLIRLTVYTTADSTTAEGLLQKLLYPALEKRTSLLHTKVSEVLEPHQRGHPITYNHYFTDEIQKARNEYQEHEYARCIRAFFGVRSNDESIVVRDTVDISRLARALGASVQEDMERYACSEATYCMQAYYKVAMKVLIDNFSVLVVEKCMLSDLADILSPDIIIGLDRDLVNAIAAESESSKLERQRTMAELKTLEEGLEELKRFSRLRGAGDATDATDKSVIAPKDGATSDEDSEVEGVREDFPSKQDSPTPSMVEPQEEAIFEIAQEPSVPPSILQYEEAEVPVAEGGIGLGWGWGGTSMTKKTKKKSRAAQLDFSG